MAAPAAVRHIGPMAQDFHAAFEVGEDDEHIATVDADGVALAAIQGLYRLVAEKDAKIAEEAKKVAALEARTRGEQAELSVLRERVSRMEVVESRLQQLEQHMAMH